MASTQGISIYSQQYTFKYPRRQDFSLPGPFLDYINQNGAVYEKLIQTCKYFFARHQLVPMGNLHYRKSELFVSVFKFTWDYDKINCRLFKDKNCINLKETKLWIYDNFACRDDYFPDIFSSFLKSIHRFIPTELSLWGQNVEVNDFLKISTPIKHIEIDYTTFSYPDKTKATLWDILVIMPKLKKYRTYFNEENFLSLSTKNTTIPVLPTLKDFYFSSFSKDDFPTIVEFIKFHPNTKIGLKIEEEFEEDDVKAFKTMLEKIIPNASITQKGRDAWYEFEWTLENKYVRVLIYLLSDD